MLCGKGRFWKCGMFPHLFAWSDSIQCFVRMYANLFCAASKRCFMQPFTLHFGISTFMATKIFSSSISDFIICSVHATVVFRIFQMQFHVSIAFTTKHLSEDKVLNILNDSDECLLSDSSENGSSDEKWKAITAEEVHGMHTTWKEERYDCLPPTVWNQTMLGSEIFFLGLQEVY
jgi:hypothetical protein